MKPLHPEILEAVRRALAEDIGKKNGTAATHIIDPMQAAPQGQPMKRYLKPRNLIWLAAIPLIIIAIRIFPWSEIIAALQSLTLGEITVLIVLNGFILLVFSSRWWFILRACGYRISYVRLSGIRLAGFAITYFSPGTQFGGEPLQAYLVQNKQGVPVSTAIASVTLDKLFEIMANFAFLVTGVILTLKNDLVPHPGNRRSGRLEHARGTGLQPRQGTVGK